LPHQRDLGKLGGECGRGRLILSVFDHQSAQPGQSVAKTTQLQPLDRFGDTGEQRQLFRTKPTDPSSRKFVQQTIDEEQAGLTLLLPQLLGFLFGGRVAPFALRWRDVWNLALRNDAEQMWLLDECDRDRDDVFTVFRPPVRGAGTGHFGRGGPGKRDRDPIVGRTADRRQGLCATDGWLLDHALPEIVATGPIGCLAG
jgi:hypothetical protein